MKNELLKSLLEALKFSPNNIPLKLQIAILYIQENEIEKAELFLTEILDLDRNNIQAKFELAKIYFNQNKFSTSEIILEEIIETSTEEKYLELLCYCYVHQNEIEKAKETYSTILNNNNLYKNPEFDKQLRVTSINNDEDNFIDDDALSFLKKPSIKFKDIGGLNAVKNEISLKIIKPLQHPELYKAYGKKIGGGILLYGPPGCGKTHIAKATAGEINAHFINVSINDILDMWIGNSEKNLHEIFEIARRNTPCVIFFDEIDALGANRSDMNKSSGRSVINQFLNELDGLDANNDGILILGATNTPWHLDPAFRRPGRFDRIIFVSPPDIEARKSIFSIKLKGKPTEIIDTTEIAKKSNEFSGADINAVIDVAIEQKLTESFKDGIPKPLTSKDILNAIKKVKPSTKQWFSSAKNYALYANDSGLYDEVLTYLKIKK
ncbi:AAA family ATPase [uncultured Polaribacter sp.]|uniref:AAA family ATPase n=1 Tax=uncultured Polaribacter sp. TaxID=174711 RepID=UPI0030D9BD64|tara:strand:+ start:2473 stop:3783 length:1311 start_codon:yes stop_codon:yes gene_type:complete